MHFSNSEGYSPKGVSSQYPSRLSLPQPHMYRTKNLFTPIEKTIQIMLNMSFWSPCSVIGRGGGGGGVSWMTWGSVINNNQHREGN